MKKSEFFFSFLLVPLDFLMLVLAGISAYFIRFAEFAKAIRPTIFDLSFDRYLDIVLSVSFIWIIIFALAGLYNIKEGPIKRAKEIAKIILACSTGFVLIIVYVFMRRELFESRFIMLVSFVLAIIYVILARIIIRSIQKKLFAKGIGVHNIVLIGAGQSADALIKFFSTHNKSGYKIVKRLRDFSPQSAEQLEEFLQTEEVDEVLQADSSLTIEEVTRLFDFADEHHLVFKYAADLLDTKVLKTEVRDVAGIPVVEIKKTSLEGWGWINKRIFDFSVSIFLIILFSPFILLIILLLKLDSPGNIIYRNARVGQSGKIFKLLKFRSMKIEYCIGEDYKNNSQALEFEKELIKTQNTKESESPVYKIGNDPRLTRMGKFIRRWSIDELPQFINVLKGEMSLVGPRPHQPREVAQYERRHKKVLTIKPGITGISQTSGRSDLSFEDEVKLDIFYIENWSLWRDLAILFKTPFAVIKTRKTE